jgi:hypothetical protein
MLELRLRAENGIRSLDASKAGSLMDDATWRSSSRSSHEERRHADG